MAWLLNEGEVLASAAVSTGLYSRATWPKSLVQAPVVVLAGGRVIHSLAMKSDLLVILCDKEMAVLSSRVVRPNRLHLHTHSTKWVVIAPIELGRRWSISQGDHLELRLSKEHQ